MKALIRNNQIVQISKEEFEVHPDFYWIDCPEDCTTEWIYNNGEFNHPIPVQKSNEEMQAELMPSHHQMIHAMWQFLMNGDKKDMETLNSEIENIKKDYPINN